MNRAYFLTPDGRVVDQDKQCLTPWERQETSLVPGEPLTVFDTDWGRIGVLICYDSEFPLLARALDCDLLLVPSCTKLEHGSSRVRLATRARALEGQRIAAVSQILAPRAQSTLVDECHGRAGIFGPPDTGFPGDGILAEGGFDVPGWVMQDIDLSSLPHFRSEARVSIPTHWDEQAERASVVEDRSFTRFGV